MTFQKKHAMVLVSLFMIVLAGYFQHNYNNSGEAMKSASKGEAVFVNSGLNLNKDDEKKDPSGKEPSKNADDFFSKSKLNREITRGKNKDVLKEVISNPNSSKEMKDSAGEKMNKIINVSEKEMKIESLLKERGFQDVVAMIGDDGSIDIVVKSSILSSAQVAQIADIASRHADIPIMNIHIKNMY